MAQKLLSDLDFNQNELIKAVLHNLAEAPTTPTPCTGQIYFDTTYKKIGYYDGAIWQYITKPNNIVQSTITTNSNQTTLPGDILTLPLNRIASFIIRVIAIDTETKFSKFIELKGAIRNFENITELVGMESEGNGQNVTEIIGTISSDTIAEDTGTEGWSVEIVADDITENLLIKVTGEDSKTIHWKATTILSELSF